MRVAVFGRTKMLYDAIDSLLNAGHEITIIGTCKASPEYSVREEDFKEKAAELQIPFFNDVNINSPSIIELLKSSNSDIAVSVNWLTIISEKVFDIFRYGVLNAHPGDLPRYKGNACPNWAIIKGEEEFAITIHFMSKELDSGDIVLKEYYPINKDTSITDIYNIIECEIPRMFCEAINRIQEGCMGVPQSKNPSDELRCYPRILTDSIIDWNWSCDEIIKTVRATASPFVGAYTFYGNLKVHIMNCKKKDYDCPCYVYPGQVIAVDRDSGKVEIAASDGVIILDKVIVDGKEVTAAGILKSTRIRLNYCLQEEIYNLRNRIEALEKRMEQIHTYKGE